MLLLLALRESKGSRQLRRGYWRRHRERTLLRVGWADPLRSRRGRANVLCL